MKKRIYGKKLARSQSARRALVRSLIRALVVNGKIVTTKAKAKVVQSEVEKCINLVKGSSLSSRRRLSSRLGNDRTSVDVLVNQIAPVFRKRSGGYTRLTLLTQRRGDVSKMARVEWTEAVESKLEKKEKSLAKPKSKTVKEVTKPEVKKAKRQEDKKGS